MAGAAHTDPSGDMPAYLHDDGPFPGSPDIIYTPPPCCTGRVLERSVTNPHVDVLFGGEAGAAFSDTTVTGPDYTRGYSDRPVPQSNVILTETECVDCLATAAPVLATATPVVTPAVAAPPPPTTGVVTTTLTALVTPTPAVATPVVATPAVATPAVATPAVATPVVATPAVAAPAVAAPTPVVAAPTPAAVDPDAALPDLIPQADYTKFAPLVTASNITSRRGQQMPLMGYIYNSIDSYSRDIIRNYIAGAGLPAYKKEVYFPDGCGEEFANQYLSKYNPGGDRRMTEKSLANFVLDDWIKGGGYKKCPPISGAGEEAAAAGVIAALLFIGRTALIALIIVVLILVAWEYYESSRVVEIERRDGHIDNY